MKNKFFFSLNAKIFLILILTFSVISTLFLSVFMISYVKQMETEATLSRKKAEALYELYNENLNLRTRIQELVNENEGPDSVLDIYNSADKSIYIEPISQRHLSIRKELLADIKGVEERNNKVQMLLYFVFFSFVLILFVLEALWLILRRFVLQPIERLLEATEYIAEGDFSHRLPVSSKKSKDDELDMLARAFNKMAENIGKSIDEIREHKRFLQNLINAIPESMRVLDEEYKIILTNETYDKLSEEITGVKIDDSHNLDGFKSPYLQEDNSSPKLLLENKIDTPVTVMQRYSDKDERERFVEVSAVAIMSVSEGEESTFYIELLRPLDKTILLSHQQKLSSVGMLASSVAHEMRNPLGSVRLILESILDKIDTNPMTKGDTKRYLNLINEQIKFCIDVTSRLLKLSRKPEENIQSVDMNEVITETSFLLEYEAKKTGIEVEVIEASEPAFIMASDAEMRMLTVNLMQNAFHAMKDGGKMIIDLSVNKGKVNLDFTDTGCGIENSDLGRIFEPFFSKSKKQTDTKGTGLGLSIVKTIVENYKGTINVESVINQGTTFHLTFDIAEM